MHTSMQNRSSSGSKLFNLPLAYIKTNPGNSNRSLERKTTVRVLDVDVMLSAVRLPHCSPSIAPVADVPVRENVKNRTPVDSYGHFPLDCTF